MGPEHRITKSAAWLLALGRIAFTVALALSNVACTGGALITESARDYASSRATTADSQILLNILKARDNLPLHFSDLSTIRGGLRLNANIGSSLPLGIPFAGLPRPSISPGGLLETSPGFDLQTLDTQEFTRGITSPVDPRFLQLLYEQGINYRVLMLLFFSKLEIAGKPPIENNIACSNISPRNSSFSDCNYNIYEFLRNINELGPIIIRTYKELVPLGAPFALDMKDKFKDVAGLDQAKQRILPLSDGLYQLYSVSEQIALCRQQGTRLVPLRNPDLRICRDQQVVAVPGRTLNRNTFYIRSVYQVIQYLGHVLKFQELRQVDKPGRCLTLESSGRHCDTDSVFFQVNSSRGVPIVRTEYGDTTYTISWERCTIEGPCDHSSEILSVLNLLLNAHKSVKDLPAATPVVRLQ